LPQRQFRDERRELEGSSEEGGRIAVADVNNDELPDLIFSKVLGNDVVNYMNEEGLSFSAPLTIISLSNVPSIHLNDINGDGYVDLLVGQSGVVARYFLNGPEGFDSFPYGQYACFPPSLDSALDAVAFDVDGDGNKDVVVSTEDQGLMYFLFDAENQFFDDAVVIEDVDLSGARIALADLNNDGSEDIIWQVESGETLWLQQNADDTFTIETIASKEPQLSSMAFIDLNADGWKDLVIGSGAIFGASPSDGITWYENINGEYFAPRSVLTEWDGAVLQVYAVDLDADGSEELILIDESWSIVLLQMSGASIESSQQILGETNAFNSIEFTDLNQDGLLDLVVSSMDGVQLVVQTEQNVFAEPEVLPNFTVFARGTKTLDMDGDGDLDIIVSNSPFIWLEATEEGYIDHFISISSTTDHPEYVDINADGLPDLLTASQEEVYWCENLGDNSLNFLTNQGNAVEIENKLATGNFSYSPTSALDLSGFIIYNSSRIVSRETSFVQYTDPELGIPDEATEQSSRERSNQGLLKLSASFQPNFNNQLDYDILARVSDDAQNQSLFSSVIGNTTQLDEVTPYSINQNINYYYTLNDKNIFAFEAQHLIKNENPFYNAVLVNNPQGTDAFDTTADALGLDTSLNTYDLGQNRRIKSNQLDAKLDYYNILNTKSNLNLTLGAILSYQEFNSNIFQFLEDGFRFEPTPTFNEGLAINDTEYNFSDVYLGVHYRVKLGKFTVTPGFSVHAYGNRNIQFGETFKENFFRFLPDFETRWQIKKSEALTLKYDMRNQFTDVTRLAQGLVLNNFNNIQFGAPDLQNALSHNVSLFYSSFNLFNYTNVFVRAAYANNIDQIRSLTNFENVIRTSTFFNSNFADENVNVFGRVQKTFGKVRTSLDTSFNYSKINQFIQGQRSLNEGYTQTYTPGVRTNFKVAPNINLRYRYSVTNNDQGGRKTKFVTMAPSAEIDAYIWKKVTFRTNYTYTNQDLGNGSSQSFQNWDATLAYRKDRDAKWEYEIRATNILDIDSQVRNSANNLSVFTSETFIQPRFITFRLVYTL